MARFLDHEQVRSSVQIVLAGNDIRCAVAFWGDGAIKALFGTKKRALEARVICDLSMGGTNPKELELLGAPGNSRLKHLKGLHAKLYVSSSGMVVTSANASNRGIGFLDQAELTECGTFHRADTKAFRDATKWFETIWDAAEDIGPEAFAFARAGWANRPRRGTLTGGPRIAPDSLLRTIAADRERFRGVGVVFSSGKADRNDVEAAAQLAKKASRKGRRSKFEKEQIDSLLSWQDGHVFTGWSEAEASAWPGQFLCVHRGGRGAYSYWCYSRFFVPIELDHDDWTIFAEQSSQLRSSMGLKGKPRQSASADKPLLDRIFKHLDEAAGPDEYGRCLCETPAGLGALLDQIDAAG